MPQATSGKRQPGSPSDDTRHVPRIGFTAMATMIIISAVMIEIAVAGALAAYLLSNTNVASQSASTALSAAQAGLQDAGLRIARNKEYSDPGYTINVGSSTATIVIEKDQPVSNKHRVTVTGSAASYSKKIQAIYSVDDTTGEMIMESYSEIPL